jgi:hypothetical protein
MMMVKTKELQPLREWVRQGKVFFGLEKGKLTTEEREKILERGGLEDAIGTIAKYGIIAFVIGILIYIFFTQIRPMIVGYQYSSQLSSIINGLNSYYSNYHKYPAGSGWSWNTNYAYVPQDIIQSGWQYQCQSNTITITSPQIGNAKVLERLRGSATSQCDSASINNNRVVCTLFNKPCW